MTANGSRWMATWVGSVVLCLVAVWLGHMLALSINAMKWV